MRTRAVFRARLVAIAISAAFALIGLGALGQAGVGTNGHPRVEIDDGGPGNNPALGSALNPMKFAPGPGGGSTGLDFSANKPTLPVVGAAFGGTGVYANYVLVDTLAASATRLYWGVQNTSGAQIALVFDDGTAASGAAPANATIYSLGGGGAAGSQGGGDGDTYFKGRVQVYAPSSTAQVAVYSR